MRRAISQLAAVTTAFLLAASALAANELSPEEAAAHVGEAATVCGVVSDASYRPDVGGEPTFLNFGGAYPNHKKTRKPQIIVDTPQQLSPPKPK